jgi:2-polyprenyl-3-methyl-5-hydroxy-6-metoxy-1,4-benzoquinol methylase
MDPISSPDEVSSFYGSYYTHSDPQPPFQQIFGLRRTIAQALRLHILANAYGYSRIPKRGSIFPVPASIRLTQAGSLTRWAGQEVRFVPYKDNGKLLDVGSGNGSFLWLMQELGWSVTGIEPDPQAQLHSPASFEVFPCSIEEAPLQAMSYDAVTMHHVIEHLLEPQQAINKLANCLKENGFLVSISPNPNSFLAQAWGKCWRGLEPPRHVILPSIRDIEPCSRRQD